MPKAALGHPAPGWTFTVVLTGQDGFSPDQARGFAPTPQDFQFGVCATASDDPHCTVDPGTVPKAMDVLTPAGVASPTSSTTPSTAPSRSRGSPSRDGSCGASYQDVGLSGW